jgi:single-strand DNA-binding protein
LLKERFMSGINHFVIDGNVVRAVELRRTSRGRPVAFYVVACNHDYVDSEGVRHDKVDFIPITTYGAQAEADAKYLQKGVGVTITGRIRSWYKAETREGGFNFEAAIVKYHFRPSAGMRDGRDSPSPDHGPRGNAAGSVDLDSSGSQADAWVREYEQSEAARPQPARGAANRACAPAAF